MKKYLKPSYFIILTLAVIFILTAFKACSLAKQVENATIEKQNIELKYKVLDSVNNLLNQKVYTQEATITSDQDVIKKLGEENFNLKKKYERKIKETIFYYEAKLSAKADTVKVPYPVEDTNAVNAYTSLDSLKKFVKEKTITIPKNIVLDSLSEEYQKGLRFSASINKTDLTINSVAFVDTQYIRINQKKRNFWQSVTFKPRKYEVQVLHSSPYINIEGQRSLLYIPKSKGRLIKTLLPIGLGVIIGTKL